jgi:hypothetical protein
VADKPDGKQRNERITFTRPAAERIAKVVRQVEGGDRDSSGLTFRRVPPQSQGEAGKVFRIATFTGAWSINAAKAVTLKYQTTTPNTVSATNLFLGLEPTGECDVAIAKEGTAWYLVEVDLTKQPNYSQSGTHVFTIANGKMEWLGVEECPDDDEASATSKSLFFG